MVELNLNWNSLVKKRTKENKKIKKLEKNYNSSLEFHNSKMINKFREYNEKIIPQKKKLLCKTKNEDTRIKLQKDIDDCVNEENEYNLETIQFVIAYKEAKDSINNDNFKEVSCILEDITASYFEALGLEYIRTPEKTNFLNCKVCNGILSHVSEGNDVCMSCGNSEYNITSNSLIGYKEFVSYDLTYDFSYKRMTHFQEWLNNLQAKENTEIPDEIINNILIQLKQERILDLSKLTNADIRRYLKKLKFNKYYEHSSSILNRVNNIPPLRISETIEAELKTMFNKIQEPFIKHKPDGRKNFLSYAYVLRKFFELLGYKEYLVYFPLLKSREKVFTHDRVWKLICQDLNWNYSASV